MTNQMQRVNSNSVADEQLSELTFQIHIIEDDIDSRMRTIDHLREDAKMKNVFRPILVAFIVSVIAILVHSLIEFSCLEGHMIASLQDLTSYLELLNRYFQFGHEINHLFGMTRLVVALAPSVLMSIVIIPRILENLLALFSRHEIRTIEREIRQMKRNIFDLNYKRNELRQIRAAENFG